MYSGKYLDDNIGHEIINLFKADDGNNYIYLCQDGKYPNEKGIPKYVVQVRRPHKTTHTLEIISIAKGISMFDNDNNIRYGGDNSKNGVKISDIFQNNKKNQDVCITFKADCVVKPTKPVYIYYSTKSEGESQSADNNHNNVYFPQTFNTSRIMREYLDDKNYEAFDNFCKNQVFIDDKISEGWIEVTETVSIAGKTLEKHYPITPADIYGISVWELPYSNAIKYFLDKDAEFLKGFCEMCLGEKIEKQSHSKVYRERDHIDLIVEYGPHVFIIENKIFSKLNGKDGQQLQSYHNAIEHKDEFKEYREEGKNRHYILLTPNHNKISPTDPWKTIYYDALWNLCDRCSSNNPDFIAFTNMIAEHKEEDYNYGVMKRRFERALLMVKPEKKNN
jgi:hypothetical protein